MARKREISFFTDIQSDEEFEALLEQNELFVLDVYRELFGPCTSLHATLVRKKIALEKSDFVQLATCNADKIEKLERFRKKCYPTIVFCRHKRVIDIAYGPNIPVLPLLIDKYAEICLDPKRYNELVTYDFSEYLPFEMEQMEKKLKEEQERIQAAYELAQREKFQNLDRTIEIMNSNASDMGVILFMPHVASNGMIKSHEIAKKLSLVNRSERMIQLTPDIMETLNYNLENPIPMKILEEIYHKDIFAVLFYTDPRNAITEVLQEFITAVTEKRERINEDGESTWESILDPLIIELNEDDDIDNESTRTNYDVEIDDNDEANESKSIEKQEKVPEDSEKELKSTENVQENLEANENLAKDEHSPHEDQMESAKKENTRESFNEFDSDSMMQEIESEQSIESDDSRIIIPPVWSPINQSGNAIFMHHFFRKQFISFLPPVAEPEPPHLCIIFPAKLHHQIFEVCEEHPKGLLDYGFFEGEDIEDFRLLYKSTDSIDSLSLKGTEKMALKVSKITSYLALDLMKLNPLYVSQNVIEGQEECAKLFKEEETVEDEEEAQDMA